MAPAIMTRDLPARLLLVLGLAFVAVGESGQDRLHDSNNYYRFPKGGPPRSTSDELCRFGAPCGWYFFKGRNNLPGRWVPSWCQCGPDTGCIYDSIDYIKKAYRLTCQTGEPFNGLYLSRYSPEAEPIQTF